uniref:Acyltransferase 3 domain-containing protein n=1 Tax=Panagrolaimus davidi TaxID=227884 RepID=A0A914NYM0_9BILA
MWIRCQVNIMGIIVGWILQRHKRIKIHPIINIGGWILGLSMMLASLFGLFHYFNGHQLLLFWMATYSFLSKPAWELGLTWLIVSCYYGYGGPINQFMSWNIWVPLGRLSYCAYLVHLPIAIYIFGLEQNEIYFSSIWQIISNYFFTTLFAAFSFA